MRRSLYWKICATFLVVVFASLVVGSAVFTVAAHYLLLPLHREAALAWCARMREESGEKVTLTHVVGKAVAVAIASAPETNAFASYGRLMMRKTVDVFFQVAFFDKTDVPAAYTLALSSDDVTYTPVATGIGAQPTAIVLAAGGTVVNFGTVSAVGTSRGFAFYSATAISMGGNGTVNNVGLISGSFSTSIYFSNTATTGLVTNSGIPSFVNVMTSFPA